MPEAVFIGYILGCLYGDFVCSIEQLDPKHGRVTICQDKVGEPSTHLLQEKKQKYGQNKKITLVLTNCEDT